MPSLIALDIHGRDGFLRSLQTIWDAGDAVLPVDTKAPGDHLERVLGRLRPAQLWTTDGRHVPLDDAVPINEGTAVVIATSGTTGEPKGVVHTHRSMEAASRITAAATSTTTASTWVACLPFVHIGGFSVVTRALHVGAGLKLLDGFDRDEVNSLPTHGATHVSLVPTVLRRVMAPDWELILLGGSAIPSDRPPNTVATYGMTETFGGVVYDGVPLPGVDVRIGSDGHMEIRSPTLMSGYRSAGTAQIESPLTPDGFLPTGDIGSIDPETNLVTVHGRADDLIVTGGVNVWPEPVERILEGHPLVAGCAVVGLDDPEWGQRVTAVVEVGDPGDVPTLDALRGMVKERLPSAHAPRDLVVVDALERTASGKIRRNDVRSRLEAIYHR